MPQIKIGGKVVTVTAKLAAALVKMGKAELVTKDEKAEVPKPEEAKEEAAKPKRTYSRKDLTAEVK